MKIHIVGSVKGGSGKSTFSAKLCCSLALKQKTKPCVVDLDLLGTSWKHIYENSISEYKYKSSGELIFLNDLVKDFDYFKNTFFIQEIKIDPGVSFVPERIVDDKQDFTIGAVFCDPTPIAKNAYRFTDKAYTPNISYDVFHNNVLELFKTLRDKGYTDIILDMPPNSDPYSDKVLYTCLKIKWELDFEQSTSLYMVSSVNPAHIKSTFEWYADFINSEQSLKIANQNSFKKIIESVEDAEYETDITEAFDKGKEDWYKNERFKFFMVFNEIVSFKNYKVGNLIESKFDSVAEKLVFYNVRFDNAYSRSLLGLLGLPGTDIGARKIAITPLDLESFKMFEEIKI